MWCLWEAALGRVSMRLGRKTITVYSLQKLDYTTGLLHTFDWIVCFVFISSYISLLYFVYFYNGYYYSLKLIFNKKRQSCAYYCRALLSIATFRHTPCLSSTGTVGSSLKLEVKSTFTFSHFSDAFIQSDLQLGNKAMKRQTDRGSARNTKSQALFK